MVSVHNRGFLHFFFVVQHLERFLGGTAEHAKPWWYFLPITLAGLLPWTFGLFVRPAARTDAQTARLRAFLWTWAVVIVCFFSASSCKLVAYVLPALPALAGVLGLNLAVANERSERRGCSVAGWASVAFFAVLAVVWPVWAHHQGDFALGRVGPLAWRLTVASVVAALAFGWWSARRLSARWLLLPAAGTALVWLALNGAATNLSPELGHEDVCLEAVRQMGPRDVFVLFRHYDPGMVFYVRRRPIIFDVKNELAFGMAQEPMGDWYREGDRAFIDLMRGPRRVFCFSGQEQYEAAKKLVSPLYVISRARKRVVFSNRPPGPSRPAGGGT